MAEFKTGPILGDEQLTSLDAVTALTPPPGATVAVVQVEFEAVRFRPNGLSPTPDQGFLLEASSVTLLEEAPLNALKFIAVDHGAIINVLYF